MIPEGRTAIVMKVESPTAVATVSAVARDGGRGAHEEQEDRRSGAEQRRDRLTLFGIPEDELTDAVRAALSRLLEDAVRLKSGLEAAEKRVSELEELADLDPLTPALNHRAFLREMSRQLALSERHGGPVSLIFFDIDDMKGINDRLGHAAGDAALLAVADILNKGCRASDIIGRLGGDEFCVVLPQTDTGAATETAERLAGAIGDARPFTDPEDLALSASWGVYTARTGDRASDALAEADKNMYLRKRRGSPG